MVIFLPRSIHKHNKQTYTTPPQGYPRHPMRPSVPPWSFTSWNILRETNFLSTVIRTLKENQRLNKEQWWLPSHCCVHSQAPWQHSLTGSAFSQALGILITITSWLPSGSGRSSNPHSDQAEVTMLTNSGRISHFIRHVMQVQTIHKS